MQNLVLALIGQAPVSRSTFYSPSEQCHRIDEAIHPEPCRPAAPKAERMVGS